MQWLLLGELATFIVTFVHASAAAWPWTRAEQAQGLVALCSATQGGQLRDSCSLRYGFPHAVHSDERLPTPSQLSSRTR
jgi:hypothetical protein